MTDLTDEALDALVAMLEAANEHAFENDCRSSLCAAIEGLQRLVTGKGEL